MKKCVFAGTFDPFTVGHADTVSKCLALFDEVVIAVAQNRQKQCEFSCAERVEMIGAVYAGDARVRVVAWEGVIVDLLRREGTPFYVRGVRNGIDFDYETADFYASRDLDKDLIVLYLPAEQRHQHISSTLVKNCIAFGKPFEKYVPKAVYDYIAKKCEKEKTSHV